MEVYVDYIVIKSKKAEDHAGDVDFILKIMDEYNLKRNPEKCAFNVRSGQFLGYMVDKEGIRANPHQIEELLGMV